MATTPLIITVRGTKKILYWQETVTLQRDRCSVSSNKAFMVDFCVCSFSECADTEQLEWQVLRARYLGSIFDFTSSQMWESNPGWLGEKRELYLCAMPSPPPPFQKVIKVFFLKN